MKEKTLAKNVVYNIINQVVNLIVPIVLSPYIARVLSAELIGEYSYALANSNYFVMLESLGLSLYGTLKVAAYRNNKEYISQLYKEIMFTKAILMTLSTMVYLLIFIIRDAGNTVMNAIMILNIFAFGIDTTWFLSGLEEFRLIALRNVAIKVISVVLVLIFVRSKDDLYSYALIMQVSSFVCYGFMIFECNKRIVPSNICYKNAPLHLAKSLVYFVPGIINTIFTSADKTILGLGYSSKYEVGVYEQANKITTLCASVINSISTVILPRITYTYHNNSTDELANNMMMKTIKVAMFVTIPLSFGVAATADDFVPFFFGAGYEKSSILLKILSINVLFSVLANYLGQQGLISRGKQSQYNVAIGVAAVFNILMNLALVTRLQSIGVSVASALAGVLIFIIVMGYLKGILSISSLMKMLWKYILAAIIMFLSIFRIRVSTNIITLVLQVACGISVYLFMLTLLREQMLLYIINNLKRHLPKSHR